MQEGLTLFLSGSTLVAILTLAVKFWQASKAQQVGPQPFRVTADEPLQSRSNCEALNNANQRDHENVFARLACAERDIAEIRATQKAVDASLLRIESKLDRVIEHRAD
jgi:hypothetical protein